MKKLVFLMAPLAALLLSGCLGTGTSFLKMNSGDYGSSYSLTNSKTPEALHGNEGRGVRLSLSPRSSVNIDVECILDYVQGGPVFTPEYETDENLNPWIRFAYTY